MQSRGKIEEEGMLVKRTRKGIAGLGVLDAWLFPLFLIPLEIYVIISDRYPLWLKICCSIWVLYFLRLLVPGGIYDAFEQTFLIDETGITNYRFGKRYERVPWSSFVAIEKHIILTGSKYNDTYEAILCCRIPIEKKKLAITKLKLCRQTST